MSEVAEIKEKKEGLFSKKNRKLLVDPLNDNNPITVQVLGVCSALAVTSKFDKALVMSIAVVAVCGIANLVISLLRKMIPPQIRMIVQLVVIATLVTLVREVLEAYVYLSFVELSVYIGLIITNCIVMGRLEAFAMANKPWQSFLDGIGNGLGYGAILLIVAFFRELFGTGSLTILGVGKVTILKTVADGGWYVPNGLMVMPVAAMFVVGVLIWIHRSWNKELVDIS